MTHKKGPYIVTSNKIIYENDWIKVFEERVIRPDGNPGLFGTLDMKDGVAILPVSRNFEVMLAKEFKYAQNCDMFEVFGGAIDDGEKPEQAANRELLEESGLKANDLIYLGITDPFTTLVRTKDHLYIAYDYEIASVRPPADDEVYTFKTTLVEAVAMVNRGEITHTTSCLLILRAHYHFNTASTVIPPKSHENQK